MGKNVFALVGSLPAAYFIVLFQYNHVILRMANLVVHLALRQVNYSWSFRLQSGCNKAQLTSKTWTVCGKEPTR